MKTELLIAQSTLMFILGKKVQDNIQVNIVTLRTLTSSDNVRWPETTLDISGGQMSCVRPMHRW